MAPKQKLISLAVGERIRMETPGGGGLGNPAERSADDLAMDLEDERISLSRARQDYGDDLVEKALGVLSKPIPKKEF